MAVLDINGRRQAVSATGPRRRRLLADVADGELVCLLGPSGSGKSTLLRMVGGFETPTAGSITIDGEDVTHLPPERRPTGMVFQSHALWTHMNVFKNLAFGLKLRRLPADEIRRRVEAVLELVGLGGYGSARDAPALRRPAAARGAGPLAGAGAEDPAARRALRQPRPAPARAAARRSARHPAAARRSPRCSSPTARTRRWRMADRIVVMRDGRPSRSPRPTCVYREPATPFVAGFIGTMNLIEGTVANGTFTHAAFACRCRSATGRRRWPCGPRRSTSRRPTARAWQRSTASPTTARMPWSTSSSPTARVSRRWCREARDWKAGPARRPASRAPLPPIATTSPIHRTGDALMSRSRLRSSATATAPASSGTAAGARRPTRCSPASASSKAWRSAPASRSIWSCTATTALRCCTTTRSIASETTGSGAARDHSAADAARASSCAAMTGAPIADHVMLLEDLCALLARAPPHPDALLQLDYKEDQARARRARPSPLSRAAWRRWRAT